MTFILVPAQPEKVNVEVGRTAVIVVDMQNDFGSEGGMFHRAGVNISPIKAIVPAIANLLAHARAANMPIVYLKQQHEPDLSDAGDQSSTHFIRHHRLRVGEKVVAPDGSASRILVKNTWNTEIVPELAPEPGDIIVGKHRFSGFFETDLDARLKALGIKHLIFAGATTSICVESTVRDAMFRDYRCVVLSDCTAEPIAYDAPRSNHEASLLSIQVLLGWVATSGDLIEALSSARVAAA